MEETLHAGRAPRGRSGPRAPAREAGLEGARLLARLLDEAIPIPGTSYRIGIDPLLGLVPGIGDALGALLASWLLVVASRLGAPPAVLARMGLNVAVDAVVGAVPLLGDLLDFAVKPSTRNLRLIDAWLARPGPTRRTSRALVAAIVLGTLLAVAATLYLVWRLVAWLAAAGAG